MKKPSEMTMDEFNSLLNQEPENISTDPETGHKHIPIAFLEADLRYCFEGLVIFQKTPNQRLFNSVDCDVHIIVFHPVMKVWLPAFMGTGTVLIEQLTDGKYANTKSVVKVNDESLATSLAFAEGKKSAAKGIGNRFGANINRLNAPGKPKPELNVRAEIQKLKSQAETQKKARKPYGKRTKAEVTTAKKTIKNKVQMP